MDKHASRRGSGAALVLSLALVVAPLGAGLAHGQERAVTTPAIIAPANLTVSPVGDIVFAPGGKDIYPSTPYDVNLGLLTSKFGAIEVAEVHADVLVAREKATTVNGRFQVGPGTSLTADLGDGAGDTTITVKHNNLAPTDTILFEGVGKFEAMTVTAGPSGTGPYTYTVTRDADGGGRNVWYAGDGVFSTGHIDSTLNYADTVAADSPRLWYRMDEAAGATSAADASGNSYTATIYGNTGMGNNGAAAGTGKSALFGGTDSMIYRLDAANSYHITGDVTIEMWLYQTSRAVRQTLISTDFQQEYEVTIETDGTLHWYQGNGSSYIQVTLIGAGTLIPLNTWTHLAMVRDATAKTVTAYVNGSAAPLGAVAYTTQATSNAARYLTLGRRSATQELYFLGYLDEVAIYPAKLTPTRIQAHYDARTIATTISTTSGFLDCYADRGIKAATEYGPSCVGNARTSNVWNAWSPRWVIGNLNGLYGYSENIYGAAFGDKDKVWMSLNDTDGLVMKAGDTTKMQITPEGAATFYGDGGGLTNINGSAISTPSLSAISANLGTITAGSISGVTGSFSGSVTAGNATLSNGQLGFGSGLGSISWTTAGGGHMVYTTTGYTLLQAMNGVQIATGTSATVLTLQTNHVYFPTDLADTTTGGTPVVIEGGYLKRRTGVPEPAAEIAALRSELATKDARIAALESAMGELQAVVASVAAAQRADSSNAQTVSTRRSEVTRIGAYASASTLTSTRPSVTRRLKAKRPSAPLKAKYVTPSRSTTRIQAPATGAPAQRVIPVSSWVGAAGVGAIGVLPQAAQATAATVNTAANVTER